MKTIRSILFITLLFTAGFLAACSDREPEQPQTWSDLPKMTVYKSPTCGCCALWVTHVKKAGFPVEIIAINDVMPMKNQIGVPPEFSSCHTAVVDGYAIEGHVPADLIVILLRERPDVTGLAVPGMPMGAPGMEGNRKDPYDVIAFNNDGSKQIYASR